MKRVQYFFLVFQRLSYYCTVELLLYDKVRKSHFCMVLFLSRKILVHVKKMFRHSVSFWSVPNTFTLFYVRMRIYNRGQSSDNIIRKTRDLVCLFSNHCKTNKFNYICSDDPPSPKNTTLRIFGFLYMGVIDPDFLKLLSSKISLLFLRETILAESLKY